MYVYIIYMNMDIEETKWTIPLYIFNPYIIIFFFFNSLLLQLSRVFHTELLNIKRIHIARARKLA